MVVVVVVVVDPGGGADSIRFRRRPHVWPPWAGEFNVDLSGRWWKLNVDSGGLDVDSMWFLSGRHADPMRWIRVYGWIRGACYAS